MLAAEGYKAFGSAARFVKAGFGRPPGGATARPPGGGVQVVQQARTALSRLFYGATHNVHTSSTSNSFSTIAKQPVNIRNGLSLPARHTLGRPLGQPFYLARPPAVPRSTMQVGLGKARNFSTARPIFQSLVENVPVTGRALWEADWDLRMREEAKLRIAKAQEAKFAKTAEKAKAKAESLRDQFDWYFAQPTSSNITTILRMPLAPTPTGRLPLASTGSAVLPLETLSALHGNHEVHRLRVSALFDRLDAASVWDYGATIRALGDPSGLCTVLEITFEGWTEERVRRVLGDAGSWCEIVEEAGLPLAETMASSELVFPKLDISTADAYESSDEDVSFPVPPHAQPQGTLDIPTPSEHDSGWIRWDMADGYPTDDEEWYDSGSSTPGSTSWSIPSTPSVMPLEDIQTNWMFSADFARRAGSGEELFF